MYVSENFKTKKALKEAVLAGKQLTVYSPGLGTPKINGLQCVEGAWYPQPHTWYAECTMKNGIIIKVK